MPLIHTHVLKIEPNFTVWFVACVVDETYKWVSISCFFPTKLGKAGENDLVHRIVAWGFFLGLVWKKGYLHIGRWIHISWISCHTANTELAWRLMTLMRGYTAVSSNADTCDPTRRPKYFSVSSMTKISQYTTNPNHNVNSPSCALPGQRFVCFLFCQLNFFILSWPYNGMLPIPPSSCLIHLMEIHLISVFCFFFSFVWIFRRFASRYASRLNRACVSSACSKIARSWDLGIVSADRNIFISFPAVKLLLYSSAKFLER